MAKTAKKCANPACSCPADNHSKYCSSHCEGMGQKTEIMCGCGHGTCEVRPADPARA